MTFHIAEIISCKQSSKTSTVFKLNIEKGNDVKTIEFEAKSSFEASEICQLITGMIQMNSSPLKAS
jgi:hypothetical protein